MWSNLEFVCENSNFEGLESLHLFPFSSNLHPPSYLVPKRFYQSTRKSTRESVQTSVALSLPYTQNRHVFSKNQNEKRKSLDQYLDKWLPSW